MIVDEKLSKALSIVKSSSASLRMYFITRDVRPGIAKSARVVDKFCFNAWSADFSPELESFFSKVMKRKLDGVVGSDKFELEPYSVISDDLSDKIFKYPLNSSMRFSDDIMRQISQGSSSPVQSLSSIKPMLWAYCLSVTSSESSFLMFRKLTKGKVVTDQSQGFIEKVASYFDSSTAELKASVQETITFDDKVDCIFIDDDFFVFRKSGFESIVGLEEEFHEAASDVVDIVKATGLIDGVEHIESLLKESRSLLKTLSNIAKKGHHHNIDSNEIEKMKSVIHRFEGKELKTTEDGRLLLEDKNDVGYFVKLLNDYYKQGLVSGEFYGTNDGRVLSVSS